MKLLLMSLTLLSLLTAGCGLEEYSPFDVPQSDACAQAPFNLEGQWELEAKGKRSSCKNERFNTENYKVLPLQWTFAQTQDPTDTNRADIVLTGGAGFGDSAFSFEQASVRGQCVDFRTVEAGRVTHDWDASVVDSNTLRGSFKLRGPDSCTGEGTFELRKLR